MLAAASAILALVITSTALPFSAGRRDDVRPLRIEYRASPDCGTGLHAEQDGRSRCVRVLDTPDVDGDGRSDVIMSFPSTCDDDGACEVSVAVRGEGGSFSEVMPATRMWDLAAGEVSTSAWLDLCEARLADGVGAAVVTVLWRFDGERYSVVTGSRELVVDEPTAVVREPTCPSRCAPL
jgi:hypothetical protein